MTPARCEVCNERVTALDGPRNRVSRSLPPEGYRVGYVIEHARRNEVICAGCASNRLIAGRIRSLRS